MRGWPGTATSTLGIGTLTINNTANGAFAGTISGEAGSLVINGGRRMTLTGPNTFSGLTTVNGGTLEGNSASLPGDIALASSANVTFNQTAEGTFAKVISGNGSLTKTGDAKLVLGGVNTFNGPTAVNGGTLEGNLAALPTAITLSNNANVTINQATDATYDRAISGTGSFTKAGAGKLTVTALNSYNGVTSVNGGTLEGSMATIPTAVALSNDANVTFNETADGTMTRPVSGAGSFTKAGPATLVINSPVLTHAGATLVNAGVLKLSGSNNLLPTTTTVTLQTGTTLDMANLQQTIAGLAGQGNVTLGSGALTVNNTADATFAGAVSGNGGALVKGGSAKLTLTGANAYTGPTTVSGGTLEGSLAAIPTAVVLSNNANVTFNESVDATIVRPVSGNGSFTKAGASTIVA